MWQRCGAALILLASCKEPAQPHTGDAPPQSPDADIDGSVDAPGGERPVAYAASGSRLKLYRWLSSDGNSVVADTSSFFDSQLGVDCRVGRWSNGNDYCTPDAAEVSYQDAQCTMPIAHKHPAAPLTSLYTEHAPGSCTVTEHMYTLGNQLSLPAGTALYSRINGACVFASYAQQGFEYAVVPTTDFVQITTTSSGTGALRPRVLNGSDGFQFTIQHSAYDANLMTTCGAVTYGVSPPTSVCRPTDSAPIDGFQDSACTVPAAASSYEGCAGNLAVAAFVVGQQGQCGEAPQHYARGAALGSFYVKNGATCSAAPANSLTHYSVGAPLSLQTLTRDHEQNAAYRLQLAGWQAPGFWSPDNFYDSMLGFECRTFLADGNGGFYCLPQVARRHVFYTNVNCTTPINIAWVNDTIGCTPSPVPQYAKRTSSEDAPDDGVFMVGAEHTGALYYSTGVGCYSITEKAPAGTYRVFDVVGSALPASSFATFARAHD